jgi:hypothetical protein
MGGAGNHPPGSCPCFGRARLRWVGKRSSRQDRSPTAGMCLSLGRV